MGQFFILKEDNSKWEEMANNWPKPSLLPDGTPQLYHTPLRTEEFNPDKGHDELTPKKLKHLSQLKRKKTILDRVDHYGNVCILAMSYYEQVKACIAQNEFSSEKISPWPEHTKWQDRFADRDPPPIRTTRDGPGNNRLSFADAKQLMDKHISDFNQAALCKGLCQFIGSRLQNSNITKILAFGGLSMSLSAPENDSATPDSPDSNQPSDSFAYTFTLGSDCMAQHAAILAIQSTLSALKDTPIPVILQDPMYTDVDAELAAIYGMTVAGGCQYREEGWLELDGTTLVVNLSASFPIYQLAFEIAQPAAFLSLQAVFDFLGLPGQSHGNWTSARHLKVHFTYGYIFILPGLGVKSTTTSVRKVIEQGYEQFEFTSEKEHWEELWDAAKAQEGYDEIEHHPVVLHPYSDILGFQLYVRKAV